MNVMVRRSLLAAAMAAAFLAAGCATPTNVERTYAETSRKEVGKLMAGFAGAIRAKDADAAMALVSPGLTGMGRGKVQDAVERAVWLEMYTGYDPNIAEAVADIGWHALCRGSVTIEVSALSPSGFEIEDRYEIVRHEGKWYVADAAFVAPEVGDALDPPEKMATEIRKVLQGIMDSLKNGQPGAVMAALPNSPNGQIRTSKRSFIEHVFMLAPRVHRAFEDLQRVQELEVPRWPDLSGKMPLAYVGLRSCVACFDAQYAWPAGNIYSDTLRVEVFLTFAQRDGKWKLDMIRFHGEAIPDSE